MWTCLKKKDPPGSTAQHSKTNNAGFRDASWGRPPPRGYFLFGDALMSAHGICCCWKILSNQKQYNFIGFSIIVSQIHMVSYRF